VDELRASDGYVPELSLVAEVGGEIVGHVILSRGHLDIRRVLALGPIGVLPEHQRRGVGSALMRAGLDLADNWLGLRRVELTVYTDNAPAIHLYEKFGFVGEGCPGYHAHPREDPGALPTCDQGSAARSARASSARSSANRRSATRCATAAS
jgi:predicted N-acetyltransferase YhbS